MYLKLNKSYLHFYLYNHVFNADNILNIIFKIHIIYLLIINYII